MTDDLDRSVQSRPTVEAGTASQPMTDALVSWLSVLAESDEAPAYWSRQRDEWLREFVTSPGNDLLAGTVATVAAKVATAGWYLEGPQRTANLYRKVLLENSDFGGGWTQLVQKVVWDYLSQDAGGWMERIRLGEEGAAIGFAHLDNERMYITGDVDYPAQYLTTFDADADQHGYQTLHRSQVVHYADCPSPQESLLSVGFCAVSRSLTVARVLMDIARYEREKLSDLPPAGVLLLNNLNSQQWEDLRTEYDTRQQQRGNQVWRQVMVAFGLDPSLPLSAELFSFSSLPEAYDKRTTTEIAVYSFALAFRIDPREIWPVSAGPLGTATEAHIQHLKARAKGPGLLLTEIERNMNDGLSLPPSVVFKFDYQDTEEDQQAAAIANEKATFIRRLWEPAQMSGVGIVSTEEARAWLVREGLFDQEDLLTVEDESRADDTEAAKAFGVDMGPRVRAWSDGRTVRIGRKLWHGWTPPLRSGQAPSGAMKAAAENYLAGAIGADQLAEFAIASAVEGARWRG